MHLDIPRVLVEAGQLRLFYHILQEQNTMYRLFIDPIEGTELVICRNHPSIQDRLRSNPTRASGDPVPSPEIPNSSPDYGEPLDEPTLAALLAPPLSSTSTPPSHDVVTMPCHSVSHNRTMKVNRRVKEKRARRLHAHQRHALSRERVTHSATDHEEGDGAEEDERVRPPPRRRLPDYPTVDSASSDGDVAVPSAPLRAQRSIRPRAPPSADQVIPPLTREALTFFETVRISNEHGVVEDGPVILPASRREELWRVASTICSPAVAAQWQDLLLVWRTQGDLVPSQSPEMPLVSLALPPPSSSFQARLDHFRQTYRQAVANEGQDFWRAVTTRYQLVQLHRAFLALKDTISLDQLPPSPTWQSPDIRYLQHFYHHLYPAQTEDHPFPNMEKPLPLDWARLRRLQRQARRWEDIATHLHLGCLSLLPSTGFSNGWVHRLSHREFAVWVQLLPVCRPGAKEAGAIWWSRVVQRALAQARPAPSRRQLEDVSANPQDHSSDTSEVFATVTGETDISGDEEPRLVPTSSQDGLGMALINPPVPNPPIDPPRPWLDVSPSAYLPPANPPSPAVMELFTSSDFNQCFGLPRGDWNSLGYDDNLNPAFF